MTPSSGFTIREHLNASTSEPYLLTKIKQCRSLILHLAGYLPRFLAFTTSGRYWYTYRRSRSARRRQFTCVSSSSTISTIKLTGAALTPFHSNNSTDLYTSQTARSTRHFGYTYPEVIDWGVNATQLASNARTALNNLYSPSGTLARRSRRALAPGPPAWAANDYQYFVNFKVDSSELTDPLLIHVFVGPVPSSPVDWATADSLAGSHAAMAHTDG